MNFTSSRYSVMMLLQISVLVIDLLINSFAYVFISTTQFSVILMVVYIIQDGCIMFAFMTLVLSFFTTYAFQAGMMKMLFDRDSITMIVTVTYLLLTVAWQYWTLTVRWEKPLEYSWATGMNVLFCFQRITSPFYYYLYKRSALMMSDPFLYMPAQPEVQPEAVASVQCPKGRMRVS